MRRRYGTAAESWLDGLPPVLADLAAGWHIGLDSLIQRRNVSVVLRGHLADGSPVVLKVCPDRRRIVDEGGALRRWRTPHAPAFLATTRTSGRC